MLFKSILKRLYMTRKVVSSRKWLLLPMEIKSREFMSKTLLACHAAEGGWGVILGDGPSIRSNQMRLPRGVSRLLTECDSSNEMPLSRECGCSLFACDRSAMSYLMLPARVCDSRKEIPSSRACRRYWSLSSGCR